MRSNIAFDSRSLSISMVSTLTFNEFGFHMNKLPLIIISYYIICARGNVRTLDAEHTLRNF